MAIAYDTAGTIINDVAAEVGLTPVTSPYSSTDPNFVQLQYFLRTSGRELMNVHQWTKLNKIWVFNTATGSSQYALPFDFRSRIEQTAWNRTNRLPVGGPMSPQVYSYLKARLAGVVFNVLERQLQGQFMTYPDGTQAPGGYNIAFEYMSRFWIVPAGTAGAVDGNIGWFPQTTYVTGAYVDAGGRIFQCAAGGVSGTAAPQGTGSSSDGTLTWNFISTSGADSPTKDNDLVLMDSQMVSRRVRLAFLAAKGFPTDAAQQDFATALEQAKNADSAAPVLYFNRPALQEPLLGPWNLPVNGTAGVVP